jgi:hypothetical protein
MGLRTRCTARDYYYRRRGGEQNDRYGCTEKKATNTGIQSHRVRSLVPRGRESFLNSGNQGRGILIFRRTIEVVFVVKRAGEATR